MTSLAANVLALPAVAPAMWLGMVSAALAQIPGIPLAPLNGLDALLLAYIAQVAAWCGRPSWAVLHVHIGLVTMLATYAAMAAALVADRRPVPSPPPGRRPHPRNADRPARSTFRAAPLRSTYPRTSEAVDPPGAGSAVDLRPSPGQGTTASGGRAKGRPRRRAAVGDSRRSGGAAGIAVVASALAWLAVAGLAVRAHPPGRCPGSGSRCSTSGRGTRSCCSRGARPRCSSTAGRRGTNSSRSSTTRASNGSGPRSSPTTSPTTPPGSPKRSGGCRSRGSSTGGSTASSSPTAQADGARPDQVAAGTTLRSGSLRLEVIWPPPDLLAEDPPDTDPNLLALVIRARWHDFTMLLTADAEAETTPLDPGPIDVLKVAHHGSDDAGLGPLLDRIRPRLAVISVGADNPYGHPTPGTLATLAAHHVPTLRTDLDGTVEIDVRRRTFSVDSN